MLPDVFRFLKITPLCDPAIALTPAMIGLHLRTGGQGWHLLPVARQLQGRQMTTLQAVWQPWYQFLPQRRVCQAIEQFQYTSYHRPRVIRKLVGQLKEIMLRAEEHPTQHYLRSRVDGTGWPGAITYQWLRGLATIPKRYINGIARFALKANPTRHCSGLGLFGRRQS